MKYFLGFLILFISACSTTPKSGSGFVNQTEDQFYLGSDKAVELFKAFDKAWANKNYDLLKTMISPQASFEFEDGKRANGPDEFIKLIKEESEKQEALGNSDTWTTEYAFSVDLNLIKEGEWVNAGFTQALEVPQDDVIKKVYNEWYYFENDQLELWYQTMRKIKD